MAGQRLGGRPHRPQVHATIIRTDDPAELPCVRRPGLFFSGRPHDVGAAKTLCTGCPARRTCLAGAIERREETGVWGGELLRYGNIAA